MGLSPMSNRTIINIQKLIETLQGTCLSMQEGVRMVCGGDVDEEQLTQEQHSEIDQEIFLCETCSWWFEISDQCSETENCSDGNCNDFCQEHDEEDD